MSKNEVFECLKEEIIEIMFDIDESSIVLSASLKELGTNSIDRVDIIMGTCEKLGVAIPMMEFANLKNIGEIVDTIYSHL